MAPVFLLVRDSELGGTQPFVGADGLLRLHPFDRRTASFIHWEGGVLHRQPKDVVGRLLADWEQFCPSSRNPAVGVRSHHGSLGPHKSPPRGGSHRYPAQGTAGRARAAYMYTPPQGRILWRPHLPTLRPHGSDGGRHPPVFFPSRRATRCFGIRRGIGGSIVSAAHQCQ